MINNLNTIFENITKRSCSGKFIVLQLVCNDLSTATSPTIQYLLKHANLPIYISCKFIFLKKSFKNLDFFCKKFIEKKVLIVTKLVQTFL